MNKFIKITIANAIPVSMAVAGCAIDDRFLSVYQFLMWMIIISTLLAVIVPSKQLFVKTKSKDSVAIKNYKWLMVSIMTFIPVFIGMEVIASFYICGAVIFSVKKDTYFDKGE